MKFIISINNALSGLYHLFKTERNVQLHIIGLLGIVTINTAFQVNRYEWAITLLCIGIIISLEAVNTCIEKISDFIQPSYNRHIGLIKDLAASSVLIMSLISSIVALIIYAPYLISIIDFYINK